MHRTTLTTMLALTLWCPQAWTAPPSYTITDLGPNLPLNIAPTAPLVVGSSTTPNQIAAILAPTFSSLGTLGGDFSRANGAYGDNVVGYAAIGVFTHAFRYRPSTGMLDLFTTDPDNVDLFSAATDINAATAIVGYGDNPARTATVPLVWPGGGGFPQILPTPANTGNANAINDNGDIAGNHTTPGGDTHCTAWPLAGGMTDCHTQGAISFAFAINASGQIVGNVLAPRQHGFVWLPVSGMLLLPPLAGDTASNAASINDAGDIVGASILPGPAANTDEFSAVRWINGTPQDLTALCTNCTGWDLRRAVGINNAGYITGVGMLHGTEHAFLLTPGTAAPPTGKPPTWKRPKLHTLWSFVKTRLCYRWDSHKYRWLELKEDKQERWEKLVAEWKERRRR